MSQITVGFVDGRMNSRILKPPGGGYSEIFFEDHDPKKTIENVLKEEKKIGQVAEQQKTPPPRTETLESILKSEKDVVAKHDEKTENSISSSTQTRETVSVTTSSSSSSTTKSDVDDLSDTNGIESKIEVLQIEPKTPEPQSPPTPGGNKRTRVPPGGFSSGLW